MSVVKFISFLALLLVGLLGLAMTVCGGGFLVPLLSGRATVVLVLIPLGSIVVGLTTLFFVWRAMKVLIKN